MRHFSPPEAMYKSKPEIGIAAVSTVAVMENVVALELTPVARVKLYAAALVAPVGLPRLAILRPRIGQGSTHTTNC